MQICEKDCTNLYFTKCTIYFTIASFLISFCFVLKQIEIDVTQNENSFAITLRRPGQLQIKYFANICTFDKRGSLIKITLQFGTLL